GPSVIPTACASLSAPVSSFFRASSVYSNCFAIYWVSDSRSQAQPGNASLGGSASFSVPACLFFSRRSLHDFRENVSLAHDLQLFAVHLDVVARVSAEENLVTLHDSDRIAFAVVPQFARTHRKHFAA